MKRIAGAVLAAPLLGASLLAAGTIPAATAEAASTGITVTVVRGALNAPKHLTSTPAGLYVTESGAGGPGRTGAANCVMGPATGGTNLVQYCVGVTGAVALIKGHSIVKSVPLPSVIEEDTQEVAGPAAVAFNGASQAVVFQDVLENPGRQ
jgi:hypothetical protein